MASLVAALPLTLPRLSASIWMVSAPKPPETSLKPSPG
jgi:hypothetical protein